MAKIIHVNRNLLAMNNKDGGNRPVLIIREGSKVRYCREVIIHGPSKMVHDGTRLSCGATCFMITDAELELIDETDFQGAKNYEELQGN